MSKKAMSLIEIMIGVIILALILVPSLNVIISQTKTVTSTRDHSQAAFLAQKIQEICKSYSFKLLEADQYASDPKTQKKTLEWKLKNSTQLNKYEINGITYSITNVAIDPAINNFSPSDPPILYLIHFSIEYLGQDKRNHRLDIDTAMAKRE